MRYASASMIGLLALAASAPAAAHNVVGSGHSGARVACTQGVSDGFDCSRIDLLAWMPNADIGGSDLNDIWGWVDPLTDREYAIVGRIAGTSFIDITDPSNPVYLGQLIAHDDLISRRGAQAIGTGTTSGLSAQCSIRKLHDERCGEEGSAWRDVKVYQNHAYIVSEAAGYGLQIFDLTQLRGLAGPPVEFGETAHYAGFGNAHNVVIDEASGFLYAVGSNTFGGGPHILDISVPAAPVFVAGWAADGYTHDAQCTVYAGSDAAYVGRQVCFLSNEDTLTIIDVEDKFNIAQVARRTYSQSQYTHQAWLSDDHDALFLNDELDETVQGVRTTTRVFDVSDLDNPRLLSTYLAPSFAIDHNNYTVGRFLFQSNYTSGLRVLDVSDPANPYEVGFFDTFDRNDNTSFAGTWSNYPFFPSGTVAVSDIDNGLFLLAPQFTEAGIPSSDLSISLTSAANGLVEDTTFQRTVRVNNSAAAAVDDVTVVAPIPTGVSLVGADAGTGSCSSNAGFVTCRLDSLAAASSQDFVLSYRANSGGTYELDYAVSGLLLDSDTGDNRVSESLSVASAPSGGGGGGGGGGGLLWLPLLVAFGLRRRFRASVASDPAGGRAA